MLRAKEIMGIFGATDLFPGGRGSLPVTHHLERIRRGRSLRYLMEPSAKPQPDPHLSPVPGTVGRERHLKAGCGLGHAPFKIALQPAPLRPCCRDWSDELHFAGSTRQVACFIESRLDSGVAPPGSHHAEDLERRNESVEGTQRSGELKMVVTSSPALIQFP